MTFSSRFGVLILVASAVWLVGSRAQATVINSILENLFTEQEVPGTTVTTSSDLANANWSFSETGMVGLSVGFNNNRHEFYFSEDGANALTVDGDTPWSFSFDIKLDATLSTPRKSIQFVVFDGPNSNINLTTNRSPAGPTSASAPPGESAMFGGQFNLLRLIGPVDGDPSRHLNPTVGYTAGDTVHMEIHHVPSPDGGTTPSTVEHIYDDGTGPYTTGARDLRNSGIFNDGSRLGFILQGIAHSGTVTDSYGVTLSNIVASVGETLLLGDYNNNGTVDAADYTVWRDNENASIVLPNEDPAATTPGLVDQEDYNVWAANFGSSSPGTSSAVPEPSSLFLALLGLGIGCSQRWRK